MYTAPLRPVHRGRRASARSIPPPIGGWNDRDALDLMEAQDAVELVNWFPRTHDVVMRKGYVQHCDTGEAGTVEWLYEHKAQDGNALLCSVNNKVFNVSSASASLLSGAVTVSTDRWQATEYNNISVLVNGLDGIFNYSTGSGLTDVSANWSGASADQISKLSDVYVHKSRLYFLQEDRSGFWYGGTGEVTGGTLAFFDLSQIGTRGGKTVSLAAITQDGGDGPDDIMVFFQSSGEVLVYQGDNPGLTASWALIGRFYIGAPVPNTATKIGSDIVVVTQDGYVPLTQVLPFGRSRQQGLTLSDKIVGAATEAVRQFGRNACWCVTLYPKGDMLLINIPQSTTSFVQHVMNTDTRAWCKFTDWPGAVFSLYQDELYFGSTDGKIYQADMGTADNGAVITASGQTAWNYMGDRNRQKLFTAVRPIFRSNTTPTATLRLLTDFERSLTFFDTTYTDVTLGSLWGNKETGTGGLWGDKDADPPFGGLWLPDASSQSWQTTSNIGYAASLRLKVTSLSDQVAWQSINYIYQPGGLV